MGDGRERHNRVIYSDERVLMDTVTMQCNYLLTEINYYTVVCEQYAVPRPTSVFSCTPRRPRTDGPLTRCTHYNGPDQQFDTRVAAALRLFYYTFLPSRIFCFGNLLITSVVRSSESATEESRFFFSYYSAVRGITNV